MPDTQTIVFSKSLSLTDDQIKALPSAPVEILPAAGANKIVQPIAYTIVMDTSAGAYSNINAEAYMILDTDDGYFGIVTANNTSESITGLSNLIGIEGNEWISGVVQKGIYSPSNEALLPESSDSSRVVNKAVRLGINNLGDNNLTGGNAANKMIVIVNYIIVDINL